MKPRPSGWGSSQSKYFSGEIELDEKENWNIQYKNETISIPSPIEQNKRHILVLEEILKDNKIYTSLLGIKKKPEIHNIILVSNKTLVKGKTPSNIIKQDRLRDYIDGLDTWNPIKNLKTLSNVVSQKNLLEISNEIWSFSIDKRDILKELKNLRAEIAKEEKRKPYMIFSNKELEEIFDKKPLTQEDFLKIKGVGEVKFERYGKRFLEVLKD